MLAMLVSWKPARVLRCTSQSPQGHVLPNEQWQKGARGSTPTLFSKSVFQKATWLGFRFHALKGDVSKWTKDYWITKPRGHDLPGALCRSSLPGCRLLPSQGDRSGQPEQRQCLKLIGNPETCHVICKFASQPQYVQYICRCFKVWKSIQNPHLTCNNSWSHTSHRWVAASCVRVPAMSRWKDPRAASVGSALEEVGNLFRVFPPQTKWCQSTA